LTSDLWYLLFGFRLCVFFPEFIDAAFGIDEFLFSGIEGVADRADVEPDTLFGGPGLVCFAAGTVDRRQPVVRVNSLFHGSTPPDYVMKPQPYSDFVSTAAESSKVTARAE
jgi:hypothetical protein